VPILDAHGLLDTCAGDPRLRLMTLRLAGEPRLGDRIRIGQDAAVEVLVVVPGSPGMWAVAGLPIAVSEAEGGIRGLT
jgi:hypothetical protein